MILIFKPLVLSFYFSLINTLYNLLFKVNYIEFNLRKSLYIIPKEIKEPIKEVSNTVPAFIEIPIDYIYYISFIVVVVLIPLFIIIPQWKA